MLDANVIKTVQATIPAVAQLGPNLTKAFYERMLGNYPELKNIFNMSHQASGAQREALFNAVAAYAMNIENPMVLKDALVKIANKHCSLGILPEQYAIVGKCLLEAIDELLHPGDEVINAWAEAYGFLRDVMIKLEKELYDAAAKAEGGWRGTREFTVSQKQPVSADMTLFELTPVDGKSVMAHKEGQYLGVYLKDKDWEFQQIRQYSITNSPNGKSYTIAVKRDPKGVVSNYLHDKLAQGDVIKVSPPFGDFSYDNPEAKPVVLLSAGSGITPMLAMLEKLSKEGFSKKVHFIYSTQDKAHEPFAAKVTELGAKLPAFKQDIFYSQVKDGTLDAPYHTGRVNLSALSLPQGATFYMCGPVGFMQAMAKDLMAQGVDKSEIHYECFGPHKVV